MDHIAIMKKSWGLIPKILSKEKKVESRWYQTKKAPWNKASKGETMYFKNVGEKIIAQATISNVTQYEIHTPQELQDILDRYAKDACLTKTTPKEWGRLPRYCILLTLTHPKKISKPFHISKRGFGIGTAWICVEDITKITL